MREYGRDGAEISGIVLAGGRGSRLGADKREVRILGMGLLDRAVALCAPVVADLVIVAREPGEPRRGVPVIADETPDRGPMAGLLTGLRHSRHRRALVIPVDMPLLTAEFLQFLVRASAGAEITVPRWDRGLEPLVGVYTRACLEPLAEFVASGATAVHAFVQSTTLPVRYVERAEVATFGPPERLFFNVNTPKDVAAAEALLAGGVRPLRSEPP